MEEETKRGCSLLVIVTMTNIKVEQAKFLSPQFATALLIIMTNVILSLNCKRPGNVQKLKRNMEWRQDARYIEEVATRIRQTSLKLLDMNFI